MIRRAAMISLFDRWDDEMLDSKSGEWYITHPYRARANNSVVLPRGEVTEVEFMQLVERIKASGCGEPGVYWTNDIDWGTNPCCEIALEPFNFCNLVEINVGDVTSQEDLEQRVAVATSIGTLQASYTNFHYLRPIWRKTCEDSALLGVSMTGIASGACDNLDLKAAAEVAVRVNKEVAEAIGIKPSHRVTTIKPAGTTSLVLNTSSGIHAWHNDYYIRRMRVGKTEALASHMLEVAPSLVEEDVMNSAQYVLSFPQQAPVGAKVRTESMGTLLERIARWSKEWVANGHVIGVNKHNVSCTVSVKEDEWEQLGRWLWDNRFIYNGISVLPYAGAMAYPQLPFEDITKEVYESMLPAYHCIRVDSIREMDGSAVDLAAELACAGGNCEVK